MFKTLLSGLLLFAVSTATAESSDEHATHHPDNASTPSVQPRPQAATSPAPTMAQMQKNMSEMKALMAKIAATKDSAEREKLLTQHMHAMQQQMTMMDHMLNGSSTDMAQCRHMMSADVDMMKSMMQQMERHREASQCVDPHTHQTQ